MSRGCAVAGCGQKHRARGLCAAHYKRWATYGDPTAPDRRPGPRTCDEAGCGRKHYARGLCRNHWKQQWRKGVTQPIGGSGPRAFDTLARLEDVEWMAETGESMAGAARRVGLSENGLERFLERMDRLDIRAKLARRNPAPLGKREVAA